MAGAWAFAFVGLPVVGLLAALLGPQFPRFMIGAALAVVFAARPRWALLAWAAAGMFGDLRFGQQSLFGGLAYVSLPCFFLGLARGLPICLKRHIWVRLWLAFLIIVFLNTFRSPLSLNEAWRNYTGYFCTLAIAVLILTTIPTLRLASQLILVFLLGSVAIAAYAWYQFFFHAGGSADVGGLYRIFSVFGWSNTQGFFFIAPLGIATFCLISARKPRARVFYALSLAILTGGMFFTFGRAAWLAGTIAVLGPFLASGSRTRALPLALAFAAVPVLLALGAGLDLSQRVTDTLNVQGRQLIWGIVLQRALEAPVLGRGFWADEAFINTTPDMLVAQGFHNIYLLVFFDYGLVGLTLFLGTWVTFVWGCLRRISRSHAAERYFLITAMSIVLGVLTYSYTGLELIDFAPSIYVWMVLAWASLDERATAGIHVTPGRGVSVPR
jgi:O-antigen ligase